MKLIKNLSWIMILAVSLFFSGCSKKDKSTSDNPSGTNNYTAPAITNDTLIKIPSQMEDKANNGSDYNLTLGVAQIDIINALSTGLSDAFVYDQSTIDGWSSSKNSDGSVSYSWKYLYYTVTLTTYNSKSESWWRYEEDSLSYSLPLYYIDNKGTSGETDWFTKNSFSAPLDSVWKDTWTKNNGVYNSTFLGFGDANMVDTKYVSVSNADKSGSLDVYELDDNNHLYHSWNYVWDKNGVGSYTNYDTDGTTVLVTGTF